MVLALGRLSPEKGHATLVDAFQHAALPNCRLVLVGDGPCEADLRAAAAPLGEGRVVFAGWRDDPWACLGAADVFVLPSLREGLPLAVLEALAAGVPVVASAVGGVPGALGHGTCGLLVPPSDVLALSRALIRIATGRRRDRATRQGGDFPCRGKVHFVATGTCVGRPLGRPPHRGSSGWVAVPGSPGRRSSCRFDLTRRFAKLLLASSILLVTPGCGALAAAGVSAAIDAIDNAGGGGGGSSGPTMTSAEKSMADEVLGLVNSQRILAGLVPVLSDSKLVTAATNHAIDMDTRNFFDHVNPDGHDAMWRIQHTGAAFSSYGENIAQGQTTSNEVMSWWMASDGHKANILNPNFTKIGIAVHLGTDGPFWVQDFTAP